MTCVHEKASQGNEVEKVHAEMGLVCMRKHRKGMKLRRYMQRWDLAAWCSG